MLLPYSWLKDFVDAGMTAHEAAHALTMAGLEVEGIDRHGDEHVIEVNVTPNRPDCLSILGIARELRAITGKPISLPEHDVKDDAPSDFRIEIDDPALCARYAGRVVRGVKVGEAPSWMRQRLELCGVRPVNNIVDITNYVLMEFGHPLHAFDLDTLEAGTIRVATAGSKKSFVTLDESTRKLPDDALMIWDGKRPVAVAGIMGGKETEVSDDTVNILIESAWFKPQSVRRTSRELALKTDASYRFERGTDLIGLERALDRTALLVKQLAGGTVEAMVEAYPSPFTPVTVPVSFENVRRLLGADIGRDEVLGILGRLDLGLSDVSVEGFTATPPSYRPDLQLEADIIEEVARLYGYEKIPTAVPSSDISASGSRPEPLAATVAESLRGSGFHQAINYSFMNDRYLQVLGIPEGDPRRRTVAIRNPLREEDSVLRTMLAPSLIDNFTYNYFRGLKEVRIFEISKVFFDTGEKLPAEPRRLGVVQHEGKGPSLWKEQAPPFYRLKGAMESIMQRLKIDSYELRKPSSEHFVHPGKSADIYLGGKRAGYIGELSPETVGKLDLKAKPVINLLELDMDLLGEVVPGPVTYRQIPRFPAIERDLAIVVEAATPSEEVAALIRSYPSEYIEEVTVFDSFSGGKIPPGMKSLAFSIRYRSAERTLTDEEVDSLHNEIVGHLSARTGGQLRSS